MKVKTGVVGRVTPCAPKHCKNARIIRLDPKRRARSDAPYPQLSTINTQLTYD
jgi:hypothetical protein